MSAVNWLELTNVVAFVLIFVDAKVVSPLSAQTAREPWSKPEPEMVTVSRVLRGALSGAVEVTVRSLFGGPPFANAGAPPGSGATARSSRHDTAAMSASDRTT